jgi:integration host factor subunit alpha
MEKLIIDKQGGKTITRTNLAKAIREQVGLPRDECESILEDVLNKISDCLVAGETFKISNFASFLIRHKKERTGRNPKTGEEVPIPPHKVVLFKASSKLKEQANLRNNKA